MQVHNIPLNRMNKENAIRFGNYIRSFVKIDKSLTENRPRSFLRVHIHVDVTKALKTGVFIKNKDGSNRWLTFKYERLSDFYFGCGKLGHVINGCDFKLNDEIDSLDPRMAFGTWMKPNGSRNVEEK